MAERQATRRGDLVKRVVDRESCVVGQYAQQGRIASSPSPEPRLQDKSRRAAKATTAERPSQTDSRRSSMAWASEGALPWPWKAVGIYGIGCRGYIWDLPCSV
eukprot:TRINITY_DN22398_c0_g1_i1.p1 TRINITY_DN22398_c0_g1~~TRINITY_DN22398_c0_g1_i1.p1  ORF type:complete len:103 (-),score=5.00 TRINITY_DN22398_c0_g1_i1:152-460(-)